jgi:Mrp family chromosome partitioning ATPase
MTIQSGNTAPEPNDVVAIGDLAQRASASRSIARMSEARALTVPELEARRMIHRDENAPEATNAFREIRTRLLALGGAHNFVTLVTPVSPKSGGSFVARNLAAAFAFDEAKTALLLDCNLRHPAQHKALGIDADHGGMIDYLERPEAEIQDVLYRTGIPRLRLIPAGRPREMSAEYFSSQRMRTLIDSLRLRYADRYIFLDGPALKGAPDARILSDLADFVVVVAAYGRDTAAAIGQAIATLDPEKLAGVVFDHTP